MLQDGIIYQDSRTATESEFMSDLVPVSVIKKGITGKGGPILIQKDGISYSDPGEGHTLILGDTGSMKTLRFVLPLIYSSAAAGESMVIIDPKGELARKMCAQLKRMGYATPIVNLRTPQISVDSWNPMDRAQRAYKNDDHANSTLLLNDLFESMFFQRSSADKDLYWIETSGQFALGICQLMQILGDDLTMENLLEWRYEKLPSGDLRTCFDALPKDSSVYQNLAGYMDLSAENTKSCILSTFDQLVRLFKASPDLTELLSSSSFDLNTIGTEKTAVFLIVPDEKTTLHFLATLFISQCYEALLETAEKHAGILPIRVNFILEEFCNMPRLEDIVPMMTAARSRNIRFHLVIQSYSQMVDKYNENICRTILDNCGNLIYLHSREISFLKYISKLAGRNEYGRPILPISRLQHLPKNETVIFHERCYPYVVQDIPLIFDYPIELGNELPAKQPLSNQAE